MIVWPESSHGVEEEKRLKSRTAERRSGGYSQYTWGYAAADGPIQYHYKRESIHSKQLL